MKTHDKRPRVQRMIVRGLDAVLDDPDETFTLDQALTDPAARRNTDPIPAIPASISTAR